MSRISCCFPETLKNLWLMDYLSRLDENWGISRIVNVARRFLVGRESTDSDGRLVSRTQTWRRVLLTGLMLGKPKPIARLKLLIWCWDRRHQRAFSWTDQPCFSTCDECGFKQTLLYGKGFLSCTRCVEDADKKPRPEGLEPSSARGP
jgi:hypothetical protein